MPAAGQSQIIMRLPLSIRKIAVVVWHHIKLYSAPCKVITVIFHTAMQNSPARSSHRLSGHAGETCTPVRHFLWAIATSASRMLLGRHTTSTKSSQELASARLRAINLDQGPCPDALQSMARVAGCRLTFHKMVEMP
jgi:hypothetical protein